MILVVSTSRADYYLLRPLINSLVNEYDTRIIVSGSHTSTLHENTSKSVIDEFGDLCITIDSACYGDSPVDCFDNISTIGQVFSRVIRETSPEFVILLGDRYELLSFAIPCLLNRVPIVHLYGGELTSGAIDESVRHCITKLSTLHFASTKENAQRIIQMGENPNMVIVSGGLHVDCAKAIDPIPMLELNNITGCDFAKQVCLTTYHPTTLDTMNPKDQITEVMNAFTKINMQFLITGVNMDPGSSEITKVIESYASQYPDKFKLVKNLGGEIYMSAMTYCAIMAGNSSSGILESGMFNVPVVNIGNRQSGRKRTPNIIDCTCREKDIIDAFNMATSIKFKDNLYSGNNIYGDGAVSKIIKKLKSTKWDKDITIKEFYRR